MRTEEIKLEINQLGLSEKLLLVEDIWDTIASDNSDIPLSGWQKKELSKRYQDYKDGNLELYDWQSVHEGLRSKYK